MSTNRLNFRQNKQCLSCRWIGLETSFGIIRIIGFWCIINSIKIKNNMNAIVNVTECCRACLRIDCSLTPTNSQDEDCVKFCDKLLACISEIVS